MTQVSPSTEVAGAATSARTRDQVERRARVLYQAALTLAAAEAAFQAHTVNAIEQRVQIGRRRVTEIERKPRQQRVEQRRLPGFERMPLAPAEERALAMIGMHAESYQKWQWPEQVRPSRRNGGPDRYLNALLSWLTRFVCSQEKPPSFSGARPKWP